MKTKLQQRLAGLFILLIGVGFTVYGWSSALQTRRYSPKAAFLFPVFAGLGLALLLFPVSRDELMSKYGVDRPRSLSHYSWGQKIMFLVAFAAGALNCALLSGTITL
jgi:Zn-dependent protease with chaperone function